MDRFVMKQVNLTQMGFEPPIPWLHATTPTPVAQTSVIHHTNQLP